MWNTCQDGDYLKLMTPLAFSPEYGKLKTHISSVGCYTLGPESYVFGARCNEANGWSDT